MRITGFLEDKLSLEKSVLMRKRKVAALFTAVNNMLADSLYDKVRLRIPKTKLNEKMNTPM